MTMQPTDSQIRGHIPAIYLNPEVLCGPRLPERADKPANNVTSVVADRISGLWTKISSVWTRPVFYGPEESSENAYEIEALLASLY